MLLAQFLKASDDGFQYLQLLTTAPDQQAVRMRVADDAEVPTGLTFETKRTLMDCKALEGVGQPVEDGLVERYVEQWMKKWSL